MNSLQKIKIICLVLITIAILIGVTIYVWDTIEKRAYFERQEQNTFEEILEIKPFSEWGK